jgi:hypothetical protein
MNSWELNSMVHSIVLDSMNRNVNDDCKQAF